MTSGGVVERRPKAVGNAVHESPVAEGQGSEGTLLNPSLSGILGEVEGRGDGPVWNRVANPVREVPIAARRT